MSTRRCLKWDHCAICLNVCCKWLLRQQNFWSSVSFSSHSSVVLPSFTGVTEPLAHATFLLPFYVHGNSVSKRIITPIATERSCLNRLTHSSKITLIKRIFNKPEKKFIIFLKTIKPHLIQSPELKAIRNISISNQQKKNSEHLF